MFYNYFFKSLIKINLCKDTVLKKYSHTSCTKNLYKNAIVFI